MFLRRLENVDIYLGDSWTSYSANTLVASGVNVPQNSPLALPINAVGRYLFVSKSSPQLTICELDVYTQGTVTARFMVTLP